MEWTTGSSSSGEKRAVREFVGSAGDTLADVDRYTSYEVTARLAGKVRTYRATALHHGKLDSSGKVKTEILDNITAEMNAVLSDESPRVRSPWKTYVKSGLYLAIATQISKKEKAGKPLIPADAPIGYLPGDDVTPGAADKAAFELAAVCTAPVTTDDVVVIAWVNSDAITLPTGADPLLVGILNLPESCGLLVETWAQGSPLGLLSQADRDYANAFLVKNSGNAQPPSSINPNTVLAGGDFRLFNRFQAQFSFNGVITNLTYIQPPISQVGSTPNPCTRSLPSFLQGPSFPADAHQFNGATGVTASGTSVYQLTEGRIGSSGRDVYATINGGRTVPWIWSVIRFNAGGFLDATDAALFPAYYVYRNGQRIQTLSQTTLSIFLQMDETYQRLPGEIQ